MSRVALADPIFNNTSPLTLAKGKTVYVYERGTETKVTLYAAEWGGATLAQPLTTDSTGTPKREGKTPWVIPGSYDIKIGSRTLYWEAVDGGATSLELEGAELGQGLVSDGTFFIPRERTFIDARDWVGYSSSISDKGDVCQEAIDRAHENGLGFVWPPWEMTTGQTLEFYEGMTLAGHGKASKIKLGASTNAAVLKPKKYGSGGQDNYTLERFIVNGNKGANSEGSGILSDGRKARIADVWVHHCDEHGISHTQSAADLPKQEGGMDFFISDCRIWTVGIDGLFIDHHDSVVRNIQPLDCGRAGLHTSATAFQTKVLHVHPWGLMEYPFWFESSFQALGCEAEGASVAQVRCDKGGSWIGGKVFGVESNPNLPGFLITANAARLVTAGVTIETCGSGGAFNFSVESAGSGSILAGIVDNNTEAIVGTPSANVNLDGLRLRGSSIPGTGWPVLSQTAAETMTFDASVPFQRVSGSAEIKKATMTAVPPGRPLTLVFSSTAKLIDGEQFELNGNFEGPGLISFRSHEGKYKETGRSKN